jgi:hypothetical protein
MMVTFMQSSVLGGFGLTTLIAGRCAHDVRFDGQRRWNRSWDAKCECFLLHLAFCIPSSTQVVKIQASLLTMLMLVCFLRADAPQLMAMGIANVLADGMSMGFGGEKYFLCAFLTDACISLWRRAPMHACTDMMLVHCATANVLLCLCVDEHDHEDDAGYVSSLSENEQNQSTRERVGTMRDEDVAAALHVFYSEKVRVLDWSADLVQICSCTSKWLIQLRNIYLPASLKTQQG